MIFKSLSVSAWGAQLVTRLSRIRKRALVLLAGASVAGLVSCDVHEMETTCSDYFKVGDIGNFDISQFGLARDKKTNTVWYRCPGVKHFYIIVAKVKQYLLRGTKPWPMPRSFLRKPAQLGAFYQKRDEVNYGIQAFAMRQRLTSMFSQLLR